MKCPQCGAENPEKTWQCLCGHFFVAAGQPPDVPQMPVAFSGVETDAAQESASGEAGQDANAVAPRDGQVDSVAEAPPPVPINERFQFHGDGATLFSLYLANLIFTICTLGIYYFWGKAKLRRYIYGQSSFAGDRFDYHGTGYELLIGSAKAALLFGGASLLYQFAAGASPTAGRAIVSTLALYAAMLLIFPVAIVGTQRFRLSRTSWRAIRFSFRGRVGDLLKQYVRDMFFMAITLGFYSPFFQNRLRAFLVRNSYFGSKRFNYNGEGWDLFFMFLRMILFIIPTLGLYWYWYTANKHRYYWEHTTYGDVHFRSTMRGGELAALRLTNLLLVLFTFGLGYPWAVARSVHFQLDCLSCYGSVDLNTVFQQATDASATGEGLADMLDAGILDIEFGF